MVVSWQELMVLSYIACAGAVVIGFVVMTQTQPTVDEINLRRSKLAAVVFVVCLVWLCYSYETRTAELTKELADRKAEVTKLESDRNAEKKLVSELKKKSADAEKAAIVIIGAAKVVKEKELPELKKRLADCQREKKTSDEHTKKMLKNLKEKYDESLADCKAKLKEADDKIEAIEAILKKKKYGARSNDGAHVVLSDQDQG